MQVNRAPPPLIKGLQYDLDPMAVPAVVSVCWWVRRLRQQCWGDGCEFSNAVENQRRGYYPMGPSTSELKGESGFGGICIVFLFDWNLLERFGFLILQQTIDWGMFYTDVEVKFTDTNKARLNRFSLVKTNAVSMDNNLIILQICVRTYVRTV